MSAKPSQHDTATDLPASPCVTHVEFESIKDDIRDIKSAVVGDEKLGHRGLVSRMNTAERVILGLIAVSLIIGGDRAMQLLFR